MKQSRQNWKRRVANTEALIAEMMSQIKYPPGHSKAFLLAAQMLQEAVADWSEEFRNLVIAGKALRIRLEVAELDRPADHIETQRDQVAIDAWLKVAGKYEEKTEEWTTSANQP